MPYLQIAVLCQEPEPVAPEAAGAVDHDTKSRWRFKTAQVIENGMLHADPGGQDHRGAAG